MKKCIILILTIFSAGNLLASVTAQETKLLNNEAYRYFSFPTAKDAHTLYAKGSRHEKTYHFTNLRWKTHISPLTESDRRNGITRKLFASLQSDSSFRVKQKGKWLPWREGASGITSINFRGYLITDQSGKVTYKRSMESIVKYYTKTASKGTITPIRKTN